MSKGVLYVMTTVVDGLVKIGKTESGQFNARMKYLENNGYANVTGLKRLFAIEVDEYSEKEKLLHTIFSKSRISGTELFALDDNLVVQLLSSFDGSIVYSKESTKLASFEAATGRLERENKTIEYREQKRKIRPPFRFSYAGIRIGEEVTYIANPTIKAKVVDDSHVSYHGKTWSLSGLVKYLTGQDAAVQGPIKFSYNGIGLDDLRIMRENNDEND